MSIGGPQAGAIKPTCKALLLCDDTIMEAGTAKISLIGIFRRFVVFKIPVITKPFSAFLQITNASGKYDILVEVQDLQADEVIAEAKGLGIEISDRLKVYNVIIPVPGLPLKHEGLYDFVVSANGEEIDRQQFMAVSMENV